MKIKTTELKRRMQKTLRATLVFCLLLMLIFDFPLAPEKSITADFFKKFSINFFHHKTQEAEASDGDVILLWDTDDGDIPGDWTCVSCTAGDILYEVMPRASSTYQSQTYGADMHAPTVTYSSAANGGSHASLQGGAGGVFAAYNHTHTWPDPAVAPSSTVPLSKNLKFIKKSSPSAIPPNAIAMFESVPAGGDWTAYSAINGRYLRASDNNSATGTASHGHNLTFSAASGANALSLSDTGQSATGPTSHTHNLSSTSTSQSNNAQAYLEVVFAKNTSGDSVAIPSGLYALMDATPTSADWDVVSDASPWAGNFIKGAAAYSGTPGGSNDAHTHGGSKVVTSDAGGSSATKAGTTGGTALAANNHTHNVTYSVSSTASLPAYRDVIVAKYTPSLNFIQNYYRWYNDNGSENVSKAWSALELGENQPIYLLPVANGAPTSSAELRLRVNIEVIYDALGTDQTFKLQYKEGTDMSCTAGTWTDVGAKDGSEQWRFASDAGNETDGANLTAAKLTDTDVLEEYIRSNPTGNNPTGASAGQHIEYDFHIQHNSSTSTSMVSFRVIRGSGSAFLGGYSYCPTLVTAPLTEDFLRHGNIISEIASSTAKQGFFWAD